MTTSTIWASIGLAALMGLRHGLDADHLAAIDGLSRLNVSAGRSRLARLSGVLFSVGHGLVVLLAAVLLVGTGARLPEWLDGLGNWISITLLLVLGAINLRQAMGRGGAGAGTTLSAWVLKSPVSRHPAGGLVTGALFALSFDTFAIAGWFGAVGGSAAGWVVVTTLASAFVLGMVVCDGLNGLWIAHLIGRSQGFAIRARCLFSSLVACGALAVAGLGLLRMAVPSADAWLEAHGLLLSATLAGVLLIGFLVLRRARPLSGVRWRPGPQPQATDR